MLATVLENTISPYFNLYLSSNFPSGEVNGFGTNLFEDSEISVIRIYLFTPSNSVDAEFIPYISSDDTSPKDDLTHSSAKSTNRRCSKDQINNDLLIYTSN